MKKRLLSLITIMALTMTFVMSFAMSYGSTYAASAKKYYLPNEVLITYYGDDEGTRFYSEIKYDKHDNMKSMLCAEMIPISVTTKYKNNKGKISSVSLTDTEEVIKKTFNDKGRLTKVKMGKDIYKVTSDKNGIINKVTLNGKKYYKVKSIKFHKNGFVSKVVYTNGNKNYYNEDGLMTSAVLKNGKKYTYKYTVKNGKVTKVIVRFDGKKVRKIEYKYSKKSTKDVWQYSCTMCYLSGTSNACELYAKSPLGVYNDFGW
ncbi:MAG: hypothetical protein IJJ06_11585 [Mogibacterium sp.]|nr:hypothetical protein [Mogibacterium sp.]